MNKMNIKFKMVAASFVLCLILALPLFWESSLAASGATAAAGSADDPLVTLSYINKVLKPSLEELISKSNASTSSSSYVVLELSKGKKLRVKEGTLELVVRPGGAAVVISEDSAQGIADLTTGEELLNGQSLPINHSLLIPRNDGRGIAITSAVAYVMVRGDYEIY
ncbi:MAG: hypothetical protein FWH48_07380 [Oscillospiraceae bacterium]|nr:hypothetical protein [Oscillospiraceae bacterium]MCL2159211.1 hypothetical protein [Oscillospiraceae bacterium]